MKTKKTNSKSGTTKKLKDLSQLIDLLQEKGVVVYQEGGTKLVLQPKLIEQNNQNGTLLNKGTESLTVKDALSGSDYLESDLYDLTMTEQVEEE